MVDSPSPGKRLPILRRDEARKVFNVAASRASDQLWVVHSLDPARDLKHDDLRLQLIGHALAPAAAIASQIRPTGRAQSSTERGLVDALRARGFRAALHVPIGDHVIDVVVEGEQGDRVAIHCDGGRDQTDEQLAAAVERQLTLERLGWRFLRVRASAFALTQDETIVRVCTRLAELGVRPATAAAATAIDRGPAPDLAGRVRRRADEIRAGSRIRLRAVSSADG